MPISTWDGVINGRASGQADDWYFRKDSQTTVANNWSCFFRSTGVPGAGTASPIPGGTVLCASCAGAFPLSDPGAAASKYLLNFGTNHATGTNVVMLCDFLLAASGINANLNTIQTVNTCPLTRYISGCGVYMMFEVASALGAGAANISASYTNQNGSGSRVTPATAMTVSAVAFRIQPVAGGWMMPLQAGDYGVRSVQSVQFSAAMGGGSLILYLVKPLMFLPTLAVTSWVERAVPSMLGGLTPLPQEPQGNPGCLGVNVLTSTTSTGAQHYFVQTVSG